MSSAIPAVLLLGAGWIFWKIFREYFVSSPLDKIPGPPRTSFWTGNQLELFDRDAWDAHDRFGKQFGTVVRWHGLLGARCLYVFDPKALHSILLKDQTSWDESRAFIAGNFLAMGEGILSTIGDHHRHQRKLLNPVFSAAYLKQIAPIFYETMHRLHDAVAAQVGNEPQDVNMLDWMGRAALELVGRGGLGVSFDPLTKNVPNAFADAIKDILPSMFALPFWQFWMPWVLEKVPRSVRGKLAPYVSQLSKRARRFRDVGMTLEAESKKIFYAKRAALEQGDEAVVHQIGEGNDILSILMNANLKAPEDGKMPDQELIDQIATLVFAATDTTSNALSRVLDLLSTHPEAQERLRAEILEASPDGEDLPYDDLSTLPYLDAVIRETLRMYPSIAWVAREAQEDTILPLSQPQPTVDGDMVSEIPVPKGTYVLVAIQACNRDKRLWGEDAEEWKPERWLAPLPDGLVKARVPGVYSNLMTFLGGSRSCIGFKFAQLEMKVVLSVMLRSFRFSLSKDEKKKTFWNWSGVNYPTVGRDSTQPAMYVHIEPLRK